MQSKLLAVAFVMVAALCVVNVARAQDKNDAASAPVSAEAVDVDGHHPPEKEGVDGHHEEGVHAEEAHAIEVEKDTQIGLAYIFAAMVVLSIIVVMSLKVESLFAKVAVFLGLGGITYCLVHIVAGKLGDHVLEHVFVIDYPQFIPIPIATVLIAALGLFEIRVRKGAHLGWFLFLWCPVIGNFGTTWALVPIGLSLMPVLREMYPDRWLRIIIGKCIFSMNMLALATLAADPPQAYWAVKAALAGKPLGFFFPFSQFWPYLLMTMVLYYIALRRFGVSFGGLKELFSVLPKSWLKASYGVAIAACVGYSVTGLVGYQITQFLGAVCIIVALSSFVFGHHARHATMHWGLETLTIFVAFFSVVVLAHVGLHYLEVSNQSMILAVIALTLGADNAAAFAAAYLQFVNESTEHMVWYNLHPSVTCGGLSPLGNGPQIALFLIVFVHLKVVTARDVFVTWFKEAMVFGPYLAVWILGSSILIEFGFKPTVATQLLLGIGAIVASLQFMDISRLFMDHVGDPYDELEHDPVRTEEEVEHAMDAME